MKLSMCAVALVVVAFAALVPAVPAAHAVVNYVALGDSFSSGTGAAPYDLDSSCQRSTKAYPYRLATARGYALDFAACSGATTADLISNQLGSLNAATSLVTMTIGGNDVGFSSLIVQCTTLSCTAGVNDKITWVNANLAGLLANAYSRVRTAAPNATVIVLGYPRLLSGTCLSATGISSAEAAAANALADAIDAVTATEAARHGFAYVSAIAQFTNHGICASQPWLNGVNLAAITSSYHPNTTGYADGYTPLALAATTVTATGAPQLDAASTSPNRGSFALTWAPATAPGQVAPITYTLQRQLASGGSWVDVVSGLTTSAYTFTAASHEAQGSWRYRVIAYGGAGASDPSLASPPVVVDRTAPTLHLSGNLTVEATGAMGAAVTFDATATDEVDGTDPVTCAPASGSIFGLGATPVSCSSSDTAGNTATGSFTVTVRDSTAPTLHLSANLTAEATGPLGAVVTFDATATDTVDGTDAVTCTPASGSTFPVGSTQVACRATDNAGNSATGSFTVTVRDTTPPNLVVPANITSYMTSASGARVSYSASANDLVSGNVGTTCAPSSGSTFAPGSTVVSCSATDAAGNSATGSFMVTVVQIPTTTTLAFTFSSTTRTPTTPATLRATIKSPTGTVAATGTARFFVNGSLVGTAALVPPARGSTSKAALAMPNGIGGIVGRNTVSVQYLGDALHTPSAVTKSVRLS